MIRMRKYYTNTIVQYHRILSVSMRNPLINLLQSRTICGIVVDNFPYRCYII